MEKKVTVHPTIQHLLFLLLTDLAHLCPRPLGGTHSTKPGKQPQPHPIHTAPVLRGGVAVACGQGPGLRWTLQRLSLCGVPWLGCGMPAPGARLSGEKPPAPWTEQKAKETHSVLSPRSGSALGGPQSFGEEAEEEAEAEGEEVVGRRRRGLMAGPTCSPFAGQTPPARRPVGQQWQE